MHTLPSLLPARPTRDELIGRMQRAREMLESCTICEWRCGINRVTGQPAPCRLNDQTFVFNEYLSVTEEVEVVPTLRIYLAGCNFRCRFCDTAPTCFEPTVGRPFDALNLSDDLSAAARKGARTVSFLGGEPTLHPHSLLKFAAAATERLPMVVNTNLYMTPEIIDLLDGAVDLYLGDFKFGNDQCAKSVAGISPYVEIIQRNLLDIVGRTPIIVRHLLMPGHFSCCFKSLTSWLSDRLPGTRFALHTGYVPCWRAESDPALGRLTNRQEIRDAIQHLETLRLNWSSDGNA